MFLLIWRKCGFLQVFFHIWILEFRLEISLSIFSLQNWKFGDWEDYGGKVETLTISCFFIKQNVKVRTSWSIYFSAYWSIFLLLMSPLNAYWRSQTLGSNKELHPKEHWCFRIRYYTYAIYACGDNYVTSSMNLIDGFTCNIGLRTP